MFRQYLLLVGFFVFKLTNMVVAQPLLLKNAVQQFLINPGDVSIYLIQKNKSILIAQGEPGEVKNLKFSPEKLSWEASHHKLTIQLKDDHLRISIEAQDTGKYIFPKIHKGVSTYLLPIMGMGKYIPAKDQIWIDHLKQEEYKGLESLSMQFFSMYYPNFSSTFIIENPFNNILKFGEINRHLSLDFKHETPITAKDRTFAYRIYINKHSIDSIAATYKKYLKEKGTFKTLTDKAKDNPNVSKLFGAPHIYVWNNEILTPYTIAYWDLFKRHLIDELKTISPNFTKSLLEKFSFSEEGKEWKKIWYGLNEDSFISMYERKVLLQSLNHLINADLTSREELLHAYGKFFNHDFGNGNSIYLMNQLYSSGIKKAWIGVSDWNGGIQVPEFVAKATDLGYLVATYDSYHSIHKPGKERWRTSQYQDSTLYERASVTNKNGKKLTGFLGVGRKLNPLFSFEEVNYRLNFITRRAHFNSWFIDCDATGEVADDYTFGRMNSEQEDIQARLKRMQLIEQNYGMVIGSEGGNDYAATTISFAHGMLTKGIWGDEEMRKDKRSSFYLGDYSSSHGSIPSIINKSVILKSNYIYLYYDMRFNIPLYQLVYNNSIIATHQWGWGTLRVKSETKNNELKEILYNVPPLYHLDREEWNKRKDQIILTSKLSVLCMKN